MAKLITKFKYLKPAARQSVGGYAKYIATREGVEKVDDTFKTDPSTEKQKKLIERILRDFPDSNSMLEYEDYLKEPTLGNASEFITRALEDNANEALNTKTYADYIATRPRAERFGSHGLFTDDGVRVKLEDVSRELNEYEGNVWTVIISLRREDAERLGFNSGERWRDMLRTQTETIAKNFKIPVEDLKWYAAFHNESHHPHVHLMVYSSEQAKPYLTQKGIMNLRSAFAKDVFADDLLSVYEKQTEHRNALRAQSRDVIAEIVSRINSGAYDNPVLENKLLELADRLSKTSGKKQYGYLKADVKAVVNGIVSDLAADERIASLYDLWYEQREKVIRTYTEELPERIPLVDNPEFKSIKNVVIQEALNISADRVIADEQDEQAEVDAETSEPEADEVEEQEYTFEEAAAAKAARLRNQTVSECEGITLMRDRIRCGQCGAPMVRHICSKRKVKESWTCTNDACGCRVRISDTDLLMKVTLLMNRVIENADLMVPKPRKRAKDSPAVQRLQNEIDIELSADQPSEKFIASRICEIASQLYKETNAKEQIAARIAQKRVMLMNPQTEFNSVYFTDLVENVILEAPARVSLLTKTDVQISEGVPDHGSQENTEKNGDAD